MSLMVVAAIILFMLVGKHFFSRFLAGLLYRYIHSKWQSVSKEDFNTLFVKPLAWFLFVAVTILSLDSLVFPKAWNSVVFGRRADTLFYDIGASIMILLFIRLLVCFIDFFALLMENNVSQSSGKRNNQIIVFFRDFFKVLIYVSGGLWVLSTLFKVNISSFLTGLSIVGAALALAAKESIENLIASFIIFFDKPFYTGEVVKVNSVQGEVEHIGLRSTRIRTAEHTLITIPNKQMVDGIVDNWTQRTGRKAEWKIELSHENNTEVTERLMEEIRAFMETESTSLFHHAVFLTDMNKNGMILMIEVHTTIKDQDEFQLVKQKVILAIKQKLEKLDIKTARSSQDFNIMTQGKNAENTNE
jgi:MscS family membrane protein